MHVPLTFAALALLTAAIVLLRFSWSRLSPKAHRILITIVVVYFTFSVIFGSTHWTTAYDQLDGMLDWCLVACYAFLLMLFSLLRPRWLTSVIAIILFIPILSTMTVLPLTKVFNRATSTTTVIGDRIISVKTPLEPSPIEVTGVEIDVFYQPTWSTLVRRRLQGFRFIDSQCNASASYAVLQPDHKSVLFACPPAPNQPSDTPRNVILPLN
jgi:hypothetical protein